MKRISISQIRGWLHLLTAFLIPFMPKVLSLVIGLSFLCWVIEIFTDKGQRNFKFQRITFLFIGFYILYVAGLLWTVNMDYGLFDLQIKLSLLIFPVMLLSGPLPLNSSTSRIMDFFNYGCFTSVIVVFVRAFIRLPELGPEVFYYKEFSWFLHPAYFSMYIALSLSFILSEFIATRAEKISVFSCVQVLLLTLTIMLLSSKAGIFVLLFIVILLVIYMLRLKSGFKLNLLIASVFLIIGTSLIFSKSIYGRLIEMKDSMSEENQLDAPESSAMRLMAWKVALEVIKSHPVYGVGTGDVKDELLNGYLRNGFDALYEQRVNAHNQFLQTVVALGIPGFVMFAALFVSLFIRCFRTRNLLLMCFLIIVFFNSIVESILEVQAGVIFFSFFYSTLNSGSLENPEV